jgi:hypothetical protein
LSPCSIDYFFFLAAAALAFAVALTLAATALAFGAALTLAAALAAGFAGALGAGLAVSLRFKRGGIVPICPPGETAPLYFMVAIPGCPVGEEVAGAPKIEGIPKDILNLQIMFLL